MEQIRKGQRLILFPLPFQGHINPMLELANVLYFRGFSITIIHTTFNSLNPSTHPHFIFHSISDGLSETETSTNDPTLLLSFLNTYCCDPFRNCLANLLSDAASEEPIACLITDPLFYFTRTVAMSFKLPRMLLRTGGGSSTIVYNAFPLLWEKGYLPKQESRLEEPVVELSPLRVKDLPMMHFCEPQTFYQLMTEMVNEIKVNSDGIIFNTSEDLEEQALATIRKEFPIPVFPIGPFHKWFPTSNSSSLLSENESCISWLNIQAPKSVVYVSFGSNATVNEAQFLEIAWGLANTNQPFLWVVRPGLIQGSEKLPQDYLEALNDKGHIVKWAPQKRVLAHPAVGLFWTHNGWNSTLESISEGVPMICMPYFTDQMVNARYVSHVWRVGLQLEKRIKRGEIEKTIRKLMVDKEGEEIKDNMSKLKEKTNLSLREGSSSYQSLDGLVNHLLSLYIKREALIATVFLVVRTVRFYLRDCHWVHFNFCSGFHVSTKLSKPINKSKPLLRFSFSSSSGLTCEFEKPINKLKEYVRDKGASETAVSYRFFIDGHVVCKKDQHIARKKKGLMEYAL